MPYTTASNAGSPPEVEGHRRTGSRGTPRGVTRGVPPEVENGLRATDGRVVGVHLGESRGESHLKWRAVSGPQTDG